MTIIWHHFRLKFLQLLRQPAYVVSTLIFPAMFFMFFARPSANSAPAANMLLGSFMAFAVLGVVLFQFGVDVSNERATPWARYLRTIPVRSWQIFVARSISALVFAILAAWIVALAIKIWTPSDITNANFWKLNGVLVLGSVPFCFFGLALGYLVPSGSALPISNLIYLILSYAGGLWLPPSALPDSIQKVSRWLPTREYGELAWSITMNQPFEVKYLHGMILYSIGGMFLAFFAYRLARKA